MSGEKKKVRIKLDEDGTEMIILEQEAVYNDQSGTVVDISCLDFPRDRFGNVIYPKKGESIKAEATFEEDEDGNWVEV